MAMASTGTIRFEDLGEPVQRLLRSLRGGYSEEDMALLQYVSVKDMAKIYGEMSTDHHAEKIWAELCATLRMRRERAQQRELELLRRQQHLALELEAAERGQNGQGAPEDCETEPPRETARAEEAVQEEEEEAARLAEEEKKRRRAEKRRLRSEARRRELQEEQETLKMEQAKEKAARSLSQKKAWEEYVANNPLDFSSSGGGQYIEQKRVDHGMRTPPRVSKDLLNRTYTPKCPNCGLKFMTPPMGWDCPVCLRALRRHIKVWQPDDSCSECMLCHKQISRFFRHHCRSCGRLVCLSCSLFKAVIPALGSNKPQKVCADCAHQNH